MGMLEATRTLCIWLFNMSWFYFVDQTAPFAEPWTRWSSLQGLGFCVLVLGQATYGEKIKWPCFDYPAEPETVVGEGAFVSPGALLAGTFPSPGSSHVRSPRKE